jgi:hypothetical protein
MQEFEEIQIALRKAMWRRRRQNAWQGLWIGLFVGAALWLVVFGVFKLLPFPENWLRGAAIVSLAVVILMGLRGLLKSVSALDTARWLDLHQKLEERLSTALELAEKPVDSPWKKLLLTDAASRVQKINYSKLSPLLFPAFGRWVVLLLALGAGLGFVPEYRTKAFRDAERDKTVIQQTARDLKEVTKQNLAARPPVVPETRENLSAVGELADQLTRKPVTRTEALKDLANVTEKLKSELKELGKEQGVRALERASRQPGSASSANEGMQKQMDALQKALGEKAADGDALQKMKDQLAQMKQTAANMPAKETGDGQQARQQMAQALSDLARQSRDMGHPMPDMEAAIAALQADQTDLFMKDLNLAMNDLEKLQQMAKTLAELKKQSSNLGKDLAEQLKNGQAEAAQKTLAEMMDKLKSGALSQEDLKKMMEEVSKAAKPGSEYGKVGDMLKKASEQMKQGDKGNASKSLADASKELQRLMDQMGDAQSLMATLDALKSAQFAISNGQCNNPNGEGPPKAGQGGKPGRGVGTWADENGWSYVPENANQPWDNTGLNRPDQASKGHSDRGDGDHNDALAPTKVRGQMNPGAPMPSITLKGVSIKGQSSVDYKESVLAAQTEAESAITQDKVPKAYQGAVKNYFDDLKK